MTAVLERSAGPSLTEVEYVTSFRFTDVSPRSGRAFGRTLFRDLPEFMQDIVEDLGVRPAEWDALVREGAAVEVTGGGRYGIPRRAASVLRRMTWNGKPRSARACPDCDGTCVDIDPDGSVTGVVGTPMICSCTGVY
ncbi:hypothetical protein ABZ805_06565 [Saccharopolyspora sp. NPDC047091]|uniref:hypothetical protein n=1 Tax=Saccharopolyspora sp. NPDC047091 TaxID=3155924 RepID=UPI0033F5BAFB